MQHERHARRPGQLPQVIEIETRKGDQTAMKRRMARMRSACSSPGMARAVASAALADAISSARRAAADPRLSAACFGMAGLDRDEVLSEAPAAEGDLENGLFFSGSYSYKIKDILPVREIIDRIVGDADQYLAAWRAKSHAEKLRSADAA